MFRTIVCIVLLAVLLSCGMSDRKVAERQNKTGMKKKNIGNSREPCPLPVPVVGSEVPGPCPGLDGKPGQCAKERMAADGIVRLSRIEVYPEYLEEYMEYAVEVGEVSLRTEPGVLTMYAVGERENPCRITILETYASRGAYERHIASDHFRRYKQETLHMVKSLELTDQTPLNPDSRIVNFIQ